MLPMDIARRSPKDLKLRQYVATNSQAGPAHVAYRRQGLRVPGYNIGTQWKRRCNVLVVCARLSDVHAAGPEYVL